MNFCPHCAALVWMLELVVVKWKRLSSLRNTFQTRNYLQLLSDPGPTPERLPEDVCPFETDSRVTAGWETQPVQQRQTRLGNSHTGDCCFGQKKNPIMRELEQELTSLSSWPLHCHGGRNHRICTSPQLLCGTLPG